MYIVSDQTFIGSCTQIYIDFSYFDRDTKQSSATC